MNLTNLRIRIRQFFRRHKNKIIIGIMLGSALVIINYLLKNIQTQKPITSYDQHNPIISGSSAPKQVQDEIENLIEEYIDYCNNREYQKAYQMLSESCKKALYPRMQDFILYVDTVFDQKKLYAVQGYSNTDEVYIYQVKIFNDIMSSGLTNEEFRYYDEKLVFQKEGEDYKLATRSYIGKAPEEIVTEDDNMKLWITDIQTTYDKITYTIKIRNKTDYTLVIANFKESNEILINLSGEYREIVKDTPTLYKPIVIESGITDNFQLSFDKYFDENESVDQLLFNKVRLLDGYDPEETMEQEVARAEKTYSAQINLK